MKYKIETNAEGQVFVNGYRMPLGEHGLEIADFDKCIWVVSRTQYGSIHVCPVLADEKSHHPYVTAKRVAALIKAGWPGDKMRIAQNLPKLAKGQDGFISDTKAMLKATFDRMSEHLM